MAKSKGLREQVRLGKKRARCCKPLLLLLLHTAAWVHGRWQAGPIMQRPVAAC